MYLFGLWTICKKKKKMAMGFVLSHESRNFFFHHLGFLLIKKLRVIAIYIEFCFSYDL